MKAENRKKYATKIATVILAILLASSTYVVLFNSTGTTTVSAAPSTHDPVTGEPYGDVMQYEWTTGAANDAHQKYSAGPAPNSPNILWEKTLPRTVGVPVAFDGMVFVTNHAWVAGVTGQGELYAFDAFTGVQKWMAYMPFGARGMAQYITKINDEYLLLDSGTGITIYRTATGQLVKNVSGYYREIPGIPAYWSGAFATEYGIKIMACGDEATNSSFIEAIDVSNPLNPTQAWRYYVHEASEILCYDEDDDLFIIGCQYLIYALDAQTGDLVWEYPKVGYGGYLACYYEGKIYHAASSMQISCINAEDGTHVWSWDALPHGDRAFFGGWGGCTAYGNYYDKNIQPNPAGYVACWDAETGEQKWKQDAYYHIAYLSPIVADGKIYVTTSDGRAVAGRPGVTAAFTCFDAFTGAVVWEIPDFQAANPSIAYGNLYLASGTRLVCIGSEPKDWSMWRGSTETPGVGQSGPWALNVKWAYKTGDAVTSSPAIVKGKVYVGSNDFNVYCLNAYTGALIWKYKINYRVRSSPAVVGGRVYTGVDDGNIYCLNADSGDLIWKKALFDWDDYYITWPHIWQPIGSPIVYGSRIYVGAMNGKVYCFNPAGDIVWSYQTGGPIGGSPTYSGGRVYIQSNDRFLYALNATSGALVWRTESPATKVVNSYRQKYSHNGSPIVAGGKVYCGVGWDSDPQFAAYNATTGTIIWNRKIVALGYATYPVFTPTYFNGVLYVTGGMAVGALNATDGSIKWQQWLGHQTFSSVAYANNVGTDTVYTGCDSYSVTCLTSSGVVQDSISLHGEVQSSPALYDGNLYVGSADWNVYCFSDYPCAETSIYAESNKGETIWSNETMTIKGRLYSTQVDNATKEVFYPPLPDADVLVTFIDPDMTQINRTATTDADGNFEVSYSPTKVGKWSWMAWYEGRELPGLIYNYAYGAANSMEVVSPPTSPPPPPEEEEEAVIPIEYVYAAVAIIIIVIAAVVAYMWMKRGKK